MRTITLSPANKACDRSWQPVLECKKLANSIAQEQVSPHFPPQSLSDEYMMPRLIL
jgi:hypothetical protein